LVRELHQHLYHKIYIDHYYISLPLDTIFFFVDARMTIIIIYYSRIGDGATFYSEYSCDCLDDIERVNRSIIAL